MTALFLFTLIFITNFYQSISQTKTINLDTYIIHLTIPEGHVLSHTESLEKWYLSYLPNNDVSRVVHMYRHAIVGFAAKLSVEELEEIKKKDGFLNARPERNYELHTTHSPGFMGLHRYIGVWPDLGDYGNGVIIGVIDGGIAPDHPSFGDDLMLPPPPKWKGECNFINNTSCNNKLIGAKSFLLNDGSPIDETGHGTHTSSTAAGNFVPNANIFGQANGTASGVAPLAHVAVYRVCNRQGCSEVATLAAMDAAIEDEVDILSVSLGTTTPTDPFHEHFIYIGAFAAARKGILVSCSAGNSGPDASTVNNGAPWILTVGASSIDRQIVAVARLGNGNEFEGQTFFQPSSFSSSLLPLVDAGICDDEALAKVDVKGKIVLCERAEYIDEGKTMKDAGAAGMILINGEVYGNTIAIYPLVLPATIISYDAGKKVEEYMKLTSTPTATILFKGTVIGDKTAPLVASFSSRGPNMPSPGILKPDIIGPGVNILAAWHEPVDEKSAFNMISGTSMACPHLSGVAALIKGAHPLWSPAMIKSAIMTSAIQVNLNHNNILDERSVPADVFAIGAGHVNPLKALDPGLVYDLSIDEYIAYLCFLYDDKHVSIIVNEDVICNGSKYESMSEAQLNYPSFAVELGHRSQVYSRTVTNVGSPRATYNVKVETVPGVDVVVDPKTLSFTELNQKLTYKVNFTMRDFTADESYVQGSIAWVSEKYYVRIPVSVKLVEAKSEGLGVVANVLLVCVCAFICLLF